MELFSFGPPPPEDRDNHLHSARWRLFCAWHYRQDGDMKAYRFFMRMAAHHRKEAAALPKAKGTPREERWRVEDGSTWHVMAKRYDQ